MEAPLRDGPRTFDQSWTFYAQDHARAPITKHREAHPSCTCRFLHRVLTCSPPNPPDARAASPDRPERPTYLRELCASFIDTADHRRTYLLHVPPSCSQFSFVAQHGTSVAELQPASTAPSSSPPPPLPPSIPLVLLLPGTDESAFDCEFLQQLDGRQTWVEASDREGFLLAVCQSRGLYADASYPDSWRARGDPVRALWLPKHTDAEQRDLRYVEAVVADVDAALRAAGSCAGPLFAAGFSNGGFMAADLALAVDHAALHRRAPGMGAQLRTLVGPDWRDVRRLPLVAPWSACWDAAAAALVVGDGSQLKRVDPLSGAVRALAGSADEAGFADGPLASARFGFPLAGIACDARTGRLFVADPANDAVRVVSERGDVVGTLCVLPEPQGLALDAAGATLFVATGAAGAHSHHQIWALPLAPGAPPRPQLLAGAGPAGAADGAHGAACTFNNPQGLLALPAAGALLVCDAGNDCLRLVDVRTGATRVWAGRPGSPGSADGPAAEARFAFPTAAALLRDGRVLVCDTGNRRLRAVAAPLSAAPRVETLLASAGAGFADGGAARAKFREAFDAAALPDGRVALCDPYNHRLRLLALDAPLGAPAAARPSLRYALAAVVCYMGGVDEAQAVLTAGLHPQEVPADESPLALPPHGSLVLSAPGAEAAAGRPDVLVVTGTRDMQLFSSQRAWDTLRALHFAVEFEIIAGAAHEYAAESTERIAAFFRRAALRRAPALQPSG